MNTQLYKIAESFRRAIELAQQDSNNNKYPYFQLFPTGTCGDKCYMLAKYLSEETKLNISIYYIEGDYYINEDLYTHAWLEIVDNTHSNNLSENRYIVDITGDQFKDKVISPNNDTPVYVGHANDFYKLSKRGVKLLKQRYRQEVGRDTPESTLVNIAQDPGGMPKGRRWMKRESPAFRHGECQGKQSDILMTIKICTQSQRIFAIRIYYSSYNAKLLFYMPQSESLLPIIS